MTSPLSTAARPHAQFGLVLALVLLSLAGCPDDGTDTPPDVWTLVAEAPAAALLAVHGTSASDVWTVGADDGAGPLALHWDGADWTRKAIGVHGDLWWVQTFDDGTVFAAGSDAMVLHWDGVDGTVRRLATPGLGKDLIFGLWGSAPDDLYVVGSSGGRNGFIWHWDGGAWTEVALPADVAQNEDHDLPGFTKVWGTSAEDVWVIGGAGTVLRGNAADGFVLVPSGVDSLLFTVHGADDRVVIVGGGSAAVSLDTDGTELVLTSPADTPLLQGVCVEQDGRTWASGAFGQLYRRDGNRWRQVNHGLQLGVESLHAVWVDPDGGVWAAGGDVLTSGLDAGVLVHNRAIAPIRIDPPAPPIPSCPVEAVDPAPDGSIARRWNEQLLNAIRRDTPRPTVHARNLYHASLAMWDAWAAYDTVADGVITHARETDDDLAAARDEAISHATYRVLHHRYSGAIGGTTSVACFDAFMGVLGYDPTDEATTGTTPRALGNRIGQAIIDHFAADGANEANNYADPDGWLPSQPKLIVDRPGTRVDDPTQWQQLILAEAVTQNGIPEGSGSRSYIGAHWGAVEPFAMSRPGPDAAYHDLGDPPLALDESLVAAVVQVIRRASWLDAQDGEEIDISPGAIGNNPLGTDDGTGHAVNPETNLPYAPKLVRRGDFGRIMSEFWADGPDSETPPGHWNTLANLVADQADNPLRLFGEGEPVDRLSWDVHVYLALNGAVHDAAIAAWELKRTYTSARPITLVRYMGGLGQRTDPTEPSYHPEGLPLESGLIEVITEASTADGERHAHLRRYLGEIAVRSWRGEPGDRDTTVGGVGWIRARDWIPYQRRTFVTPAFPGYISGHSTFSRSAAEVLTELTGSPYFPGGMGHYRFEPGYLFFESGPSAPVDLQWATYYDASDQAGQSRLWGGIHVIHDDLDGRRVGAVIGAAAVALARGYYDGSAVEE